MFTILWTDGAVCFSFLSSALPRAHGDSRVPLLSSALPGGELSSGLQSGGPGTHKVLRARSVRTALATPWNMPCGLPAWRKVTPGPPTARVSLTLPKSKRLRCPLLSQGPLPTRAPARAPAARASFLPLARVKQVKAGAMAGTGSPGLGAQDRESGPGQWRGPGPATTHRKNSGEEGLSLVEPASLKPELASFSHLTL